MPRAKNITVQNNFTKGLITEHTGLTFPENACTDTDNCTFDRIGLVSRRRGMAYELNRTLTTIDRDDVAISTFKWTNAGGDGNTEVYVLQVGGTLHFYKTSAATVTDPLSDQKLASTITLANFIPTGGPSPNAKECTYTTGNGYLFVFHPGLEPIYCTYTAGTITAALITVQIRDVIGVEGGLEDSFRPPGIDNAHFYNLQNQGWTSSPAWSAHSTVFFSAAQITPLNNKAFTDLAGLVGVIGGQPVTIRGYFVDSGVRYHTYTLTGSVASYASPTLTISVTAVSATSWALFYPNCADWDFSPSNFGYIDTWFGVTGNYPSNSDVWWLYKNSSGVFDPATTLDKVTVNSGPAPRGHYVLDAFNYDRTSVSGFIIPTFPTTVVRPKTGTWFQGRVWFAGTDATPFTENIYFSQIVERPVQFGRCYQTNDPTSEDRFDLLPSDGGVIRIQGAASVYKLFPIQNGLLVFAANGIWFITGSQGIGFTANDYTVTKISAVQSISPTSFVDVQGYPVFWNEEGIYTISPGQQGNLSVNSLTDSTIASFYEDIPLSSKKFARGDYDPISTLIQWIYQDTESTTVTNRYEFNKILNYNVSGQAFYPWTVTSATKINGINYMVGPGGSTSPSPVFKYLTSTPNVATYDFTFSEERDSNYLDWSEAFSSFFITGYAVRGEAARKFQDNYVYIYSDSSEVDTSFKIRGQWDYALDPDTGRWSTAQTLNVVGDGSFRYKPKRVKIRGHGKACSLHVLNNLNSPFEIIGWSVYETGNQGI